MRFDVPAGATYHFASTPVCPLSVIEAAATTAPACPSGSRIGYGTTGVQAPIATQTLTENATLDLYLTSHNPVRYEVWSRATTPIQQTLMFGGAFVPTSPPYGGAITVSIPPIPTVPGAADASIVSLDLTIGGLHRVTTTAAVRRGRRSAKRMVTTMDGLFDLPKRCPGALPYSASTTYADGTTAAANGHYACP